MKGGATMLNNYRINNLKGFGFSTDTVVSYEDLRQAEEEKSIREYNDVMFINIKR